MRFNRLYIIFLLFISLISCEKKITPKPINDYTQTDTIITISAVGDIMTGSSYPSKDFLPANSGINLMDSIIQYFKNSDIVFGNLEGVLLDSGGNPKKCDDERFCYRFRMPEEHVNILKKAGFNLLSTANNHVNDFGIEGIYSTGKVLTKNKINFAGFIKNPSCMLKINNINIGFAAFAPLSETNNMLDYENAKKIISELSNRCSIVIISVHAGAEGSEHQHVSKQTEFFLNENRGNIYEFSRMAIDNGADLLLCHGPHVLRGIDYYKGRLIIYSMGNFCTYKQINTSGLNGISAIFKVSLLKNGEFKKALIIPTIQHRKAIPEFDKRLQAIGLIQSLINEDFQDSKLNINDNGEIIPP